MISSFGLVMEFYGSEIVRILMGCCIIFLITFFWVLFQTKMISN